MVWPDPRAMQYSYAARLSTFERSTQWEVLKVEYLPFSSQLVSLSFLIQSYAAKSNQVTQAPLM